MNNSNTQCQINRWGTREITLKLTNWNGGVAEKSKLNRLPDFCGARIMLMGPIRRSAMFTCNPLLPEQSSTLLSSGSLLITVPNRPLITSADPHRLDPCQLSDLSLINPLSAHYHSSLSMFGLVLPPHPISFDVFKHVCPCFSTYLMRTRPVHDQLAQNCCQPELWPAWHPKPSWSWPCTYILAH